MSISTKIIGLIASVCLVMLLLLGVIGFLLISEEGTKGAHRTLDATKNVFQHEIDTIISSNQDSAIIMSRNFDMARSLKNGDYSNVQRIAGEVKKSFRSADIVAIYSKDGNLAAEINPNNLPLLSG